MSFTILQATEFACASLAYSASVQAGLDVNIYNGMDNQTKAAPAIICNAITAPEDKKGSGVKRIYTEIKVKTLASTPDSQSIQDGGEISRVIWDAFTSDTIATDLTNQASGLIAYDLILGDERKSEEGNAWVQTLPVEIIGVLAN